jgi:hypothetical protein
MNGTAEFYSEYHRVSPVCSSFVDVLQNHAVCMHELTAAEGKGCKRGLMRSWVKVCRLNDEWIGMLCVTNTDREFEKTTEQLLTSYSEALCDYVLDRATGPVWTKKIAAIVQLEAKFFRAIGSCECSSQWYGYTAAVIAMVDAMVKYGAESPIFFGYSADCIRNGKALGACLDTLRKRK